MKKLFVIMLSVLVAVPVFAEVLEFAEYSLDQTWVGYYSSQNDFGNRSNDTWVEIQGGIDYYWRTQRMIIRNDLSSIPVGSNIISATLSIYGVNHGGPGGAVEVYAIEPTAAWTKTGASWNTMDGTNLWPTTGTGAVGYNLYGGWLTPGAIDSEVVTGSTQIPELPFDVTSVVQDWVDGTRGNQGLALTFGSGLDDSSYFYWYNNNATGGALGAGTRLSVLYEVPEPTTIILLGIGSLIGLKRRK